jgi:DNA polymerase III sliding clamp (beta) subunit (PCNA family)
VPTDAIRLPDETPAPAAELSAEAEPGPSVEQITANELRLMKELRSTPPTPERILEAAPLIQPSLVAPVHVNAMLFRQFLDALSFVAREAADVPILRNVRMTYNEGEMVLEATDHSVWAIARLKAHGGADGFECVLPLGRALNVIRRISAHYATLSLGIDKDSIHIGPYSFPHGGSIRDYPQRMPLQPEELKAALPAHYLESIVERVGPVVPRDHDRPSLRGVHLDFNEGVAVATDGHRLHALVLHDLQIATKNSYRARPSVTLTLAAFEYLRAVSDREWVGLVINEKLVTAAGEDFGIMAKPLPGPFANWRRVIPNYPGYWITGKEALLEALKEAEPLESPCIKLSVDSLADRLIVSTRRDKGDSYQRAIPAHRRGGSPTLRCALDPIYLRDAVQATAGGLVRLGFDEDNTEERPITVRGEEDDFLAVVMPRQSE